MTEKKIDLSRRLIDVEEKTFMLGFKHANV